MMLAFFEIALIYSGNNNLGGIPIPFFILLFFNKWENVNLWNNKNFRKKIQRPIPRVKQLNLGKTFN